MHVRLVMPQEHAALGRLTVEAFRALGGPRFDEYEAELADVARRAAALHTEVAVAVEGSDIVGGVTYVDGPASPLAEEQAEDEAGIRMLAVASAWQGRGVGRALVQWCIDRATAGGWSAVFLHSTDTMLVAQRIYTRMGFDRCPERDWPIFDDLTLRAFRLALPAEAPSTASDPRAVARPS